jgi:hypothetical protein
MKFLLIPKGWQRMVLSMLLAVFVPGAALADSAVDTSDAKARAVLRQMTDYLAEITWSMLFLNLNRVPAGSSTNNRFI